MGVVCQEGLMHVYLCRCIYSALYGTMAAISERRVCKAAIIASRVFIASRHNDVLHAMTLQFVVSSSSFICLDCLWHVDNDEYYYDNDDNNNVDEAKIT